MANPGTTRRRDSGGALSSRRPRVQPSSTCVFTGVSTGTFSDLIFDPISSHNSRRWWDDAPEAVRFSDQPYAPGQQFLHHVLLEIASLGELGLQRGEFGVHV